MDIVLVLVVCQLNRILRAFIASLTNNLEDFIYDRVVWSIKLDQANRISMEFLGRPFKSRSIRFEISPRPVTRSNNFLT